MMGSPGAAEVTAAIEAVVRQDRGRLLSALISRLRDFQLAEDALQDALASAVVHWGRAGLPASPQGWLLRVAMRKAIDRLRISAREAQKAAAIAVLFNDEADVPEADSFPDDRLKLIFTCCHPALEPKTRVALTLRTLGGLTTAEVARAFLDPEPTMGQRLTRARAKILAAGIPYSVPGPQDWAERLQSVLAVIYLIFNQGYSAPSQDQTPRAALCAEAIDLVRMLDSLRPQEPEIEGLAALMLITDARSSARLDVGGASVAIADQDRGLWHHGQILEGLALLDAAMARRAPGPFQMKAAIAALHVQADPPDWPQIVLLYDSLLRIEPTPVVRLNRAVALAEAGAVQAGLQTLEALSSELYDYQPYHAALADLLRRNGQIDSAIDAYDRAIALTTNPADAAFLGKRRAAATKPWADGKTLP
ncbi:MAG: RNA polymerase sigma factor [Paracoccaceae bacterium]